MDKINASDIIILQVISLLLKAGRHCISNISYQTSNILCFLGDIIELYTVKHFKIPSELELVFEAYDINFTFLNDIYESIFVGSLDTFIDIVESSRDLFSIPANLINNNVSAPSNISNKSFLGIFVRNLLVRWELSSISELGLLFDDVSDFIQKSKRFHNHNHDAYENKIELLKSYSVSFNNAPKLDLIIDGYYGEAQCHNNFDTATTDLFSTNTSNLIGTLQSVSKSQQNGVPRHQHAVLNLATLWIRNGHYSKAIHAIEESMKTAHQRGDHVTITRSLLLLHIVADEVCQDSDAATSLVSAEESLLRCLSRCEVLKLKSLSARATILLAKYRIQKSLKYNFLLTSSNVQVISYPVSQDKELSNSVGAEGSFENIWALLLTSQLNNSLVPAIVAGVQSNTTQNALKVETVRNAAEGEITIKEANVLAVPAAIVSADIWARLGLFSLAQLYCLRALKLYGSQIDTSLLITLCCKLIQYLSRTSNTDGAWLLPDLKPHDILVARGQCHLALNILDWTKTFLRNQETSYTLENTVRSSIIEIELQLSMLSEDWKTAQSKATTLMEAYDDGNKKKISVDYLQAKLDHAIALSKTDTVTAIRDMEQLIEICISTNNMQLVEIVRIRKALLLFSRGSSTQRADALLDISRAVNFSRLRGFPVVEALACAIYAIHMI